MNEKNRNLLFDVVVKREDVEIEIEQEFNKIKNLLNNENYRTMSCECNIDFYIDQLKKLRDMATKRERLIAEEKAIQTVILNL